MANLAESPEDNGQVEQFCEGYCIVMNFVDKNISIYINPFHILDQYLRG